MAPATTTPATAPRPISSLPAPPIWSTTVSNSYDSQSHLQSHTAQDLDQLQPPMRSSQRDTSRLACAAHLRHSIEFAQHEIAYWEGVVKQLTLAAEDMERK